MLTESGSKFYLCPDPDCSLVLDVACALPLKITHRSHEHRLVAAARLSFLICGVCGNKHDTTSPRSYSCNVCGFWIHGDCAVLPNVIEHKFHTHPLVLYYDAHAARTAKLSPAVYWSQAVDHYFTRLLHLPDLKICFCKMCLLPVRTRQGVYSCIECHKYTIHIKCATSHPGRFKVVSSRKARFSSLVHLPLPDEHLSFVGYVRKAISRDGAVREEHQSFLDYVTQVISADGAIPAYIRSIVGAMMKSSSSLLKYTAKIQHDYPLLRDVKCEFILHNDDDDDDGRRRHRVCDACVKVIDTPPFYNCSGCPNFFLHHYCYHVEYFFSAHPAHRGHVLILQHYHNPRRLVGKRCRSCGCECTRLFYECMQCKDDDDFVLDVSCALMPGLLTHEAHSTEHFLHLTEVASDGARTSNEMISRDRCHCCGQSLGELAYECRSCHNFALHTWCAMLPKTVAHKFDPHPLSLTTANNSSGVVDAGMIICEICEKDMDNEVWCYSCSQCEQSFHVDCIPCLDMVYKIKSLASVGEYDDAPTRLIRGLTLHGRGHDYCSNVADEYDILASD